MQTHVPTQTELKRPYLWSLIMGNKFTKNQIRVWLDEAVRKARSAFTEEVIG